MTKRNYMIVNGIKCDFDDLDSAFKLMLQNGARIRLVPEKYKEQYLQFKKEHRLCIICKKVMKRPCKNHCGDCEEQYKVYRLNVKRTLEQNNLKKYGVASPNSLPEIKEKIKRTNLERYGYEHVSSSPIFKEKVKQTCLKRYGVENPNQNPDAKAKAKQTCLEKYGVDHPLKSKKIKDKTIQSNIENYGVEFTNQRHIKNYENYNEQFIRDNFIKDGYLLKDELMDYFGISRFGYCSLREKYNITEPVKQNNQKTQSFIFNNIKIENKILNERDILNGLELDIYLPDQKLAVEHNGLMFHSQGLKKYSMFPGPDFDKNYHLKKTELCNQNGIQLFHIFEGEDLDLWLSMINNKLGLSKRIFARKCIIKELNNKDVLDFLNENHIQGFCSAKINLGLFYNNELVQVMTFSKPRFNKNYEYELIRLCSLKNTTVVGGPSKLLNYFKKVYKPKSIISYANRRFSNGSIYEKLGFKLIGKSNPNYFYFKEYSKQLESRNKYQKHKLSKLLDIYDETLSEPQNMFNNGYRRIFDCGNLVYELILN